MLHNEKVNEVNQLLDRIEELKEDFNSKNLKTEIFQKERELVELKWDLIPREFHFALEDLQPREEFPFFEHFEDFSQII